MHQDIIMNRETPKQKEKDWQSASSQTDKDFNNYKKNNGIIFRISYLYIGFRDFLHYEQKKESSTWVVDENSFKCPKKKPHKFNFMNYEKKEKLSRHLNMYVGTVYILLGILPEL